MLLRSLDYELPWVSKSPRQILKNAVQGSGSRIWRFGFRRSDLGEGRIWGLTVKKCCLGNWSREQVLRIKVKTLNPSYLNPKVYLFGVLAFWNSIRNQGSACFPAPAILPCKQLRA